MKSRFLPIVLVLSIVFIAAFGFLGMTFIDHSGSYSCFFSMFGAGDCSSITNAISLASHHISGLQFLTQSIMGFDTTILLFSLLLLVLISFSSFKLLRQNILALFCQTRHSIEKLDFVPNRQFLRWLALHSKRDPHALKWVHVLA